jgi:hypothetical protein
MVSRSSSRAPPPAGKPPRSRHPPASSTNTHPGTSTKPETEDEWYKRTENGALEPIGPATATDTAGTIPFQGSFKDATADLTHLVWTAEVSAGGQWPFDHTEGEYSLYEYVGTHNPHPFLVSVEGEQGSTKLISKQCSTELGGEFVGERVDQDWNAMSADGRTVYFHTCTGLYVRVDGETSEAHTLKISEHGEFARASNDGSKAFYLEDEGLYESECYAGCETLGEQRRQIDVTAGTPTPGVLGVTAVSADGSHAYFVANGVLAGGATPGDCQHSSEAQEALQHCNLYVYERDERYPAGHLAFIASLTGTDASLDWLENVTANVTPDGRFLVFESHGDLTPDDTYGEGYTQVFRYDAESGQLARVSIGQDGFNDDGNLGVGAATIVSSTEALHGGTLGPPRGDPTMSDDGSYVFFQSPVALTPHALDDEIVGYLRFGTVNEVEYAQNVYEYHEGRVYLISDGHDTTDALTPCTSRVSSDSSPVDSELFRSAVCLLGSDASGHNVFFMTGDQLVLKDTDTQVDIYDARVCEPEDGNPCITEPSAPLPPCDGENCHGIPAATPAVAGVPTASFSGAGNVSPPPPVSLKVESVAEKRAKELAKALKACRRKHSKRARVLCEAKARKAYGAKKASTSGAAKRASDERRTSR